MSCVLTRICVEEVASCSLTRLRLRRMHLPEGVSSLKMVLVGVKNVVQRGGKFVLCSLTRICIYFAREGGNFEFFANVRVSSRGRGKLLL